MKRQDKFMIPLMLFLAFCSAYVVFKYDLKPSVKHDKKQKKIQNEIENEQTYYTTDISNKQCDNLTQNDILNIALKNLTFTLHKQDNFPYVELKKRIKRVTDTETDEVAINNYTAPDKHAYEMCGSRNSLEWFGSPSGNEYATAMDTNCEFWKVDKRLNYDYLLNLGDKICINGVAREEYNSDKAYWQILSEDEIYSKRELFYPWQEDRLVDENGTFIVNFIYDGIYNKNTFFANEAFLIDNKKYGFKDGEYTLVLANENFHGENDFLSQPYRDYPTYCMIQQEILQGKIKIIYDKSKNIKEEIIIDNNTTKKWQGNIFNFISIGVDKCGNIVGDFSSAVRNNPKSIFFEEYKKHFNKN